MIEVGHPGQLILVAASGLAREAAEAATASGRRVLGFLDDDQGKQGRTVSGWPVLGSLDDVSDFPDAALIVCVGRGAGRRAVVDKLREQGIGAERYTTVVDPSVRVPASCSVGGGSILLAGVVLTADVAVGRHVVVMPNATLTHDDTLDDYATVCAGVTLGGSVTVGRGAYLGMDSSVREGCTIGAASTVGMGAAVVGDVPPGVTVVGVPARPYAARSSADHGG